MKRLGIYLNDHLAGATGGLALVRRLQAENRNTPLAGDLRLLASELDEDRATLEGVLSALRLERDNLKVLLAWLAEKVGRLKFNGRLLGYSPLSRLEELESLTLGAESRLALWRTLQRLARRDERLQRFDFNTLLIRAERHHRLLERWRQQAVDDAFEEKRADVVRLGRPSTQPPAPPP